MNMIKRVLLFLSVLSLLFIVASCNTDTMAQDERIAAFMSDLNAGDLGSLHTHIHPDNSVRNQRKDPSTWTMFSGTDSFSYSNYTELSSTSVRVDITSTDPTFDGEKWTFTMKEDTKDLWYINRLISTGSVTTIIP